MEYRYNNKTLARSQIFLKDNPNCITIELKGTCIPHICPKLVDKQASDEFCRDEKFNLCKRCEFIYWNQFEK